MIKRLIIVLLSLALVFGGVAAWKYAQIKKMSAFASMGPPPAVIATATVQHQQWQPHLSAVGSLVASQGVFVSNQIAGQVTGISFDSGETVTAGQTLVQLDDEVDRAELKARLAALKLAQLEFERTAKLMKNRSASQADYDKARATLDGAKALIASAQASIHKKAIQAPFDGVLGIRQVDLGQYLPAGAPIVSLQALNPLFADYNLPERYLGQVAVGHEVRVKVQAYADKTFSGRISVVSPRVEAGTRSLRLRATLDNPDTLLRPGMFAQIDTLAPAQREVLTLPQRAITYNPYGDAVFLVIEKDGKRIVQNQTVQTGEVRQGQIEILEGLKEGDVVVSAGLNKLRNGQPVQIDNSVKLDGEVGR